MKVFIPTEKYEGLQSQVFDHFGRSPYFIIYDTGKDAVDVIVSMNKFLPYDKCSPLRLINEHACDVVLCKNIGLKALIELSELGIKVYKSKGSSLKDVLDEYKSNQWGNITILDSCINSKCEAKDKKCIPS